LAREYNQYAWLVSNTEGDYAKALDYSLKSLELELDGAKLDTCARCYFALGEFDNAIRMQKRALKYMPHSPPLLRQLDEIEGAKAKATSAANEITDDNGEQDPPAGETKDNE
jgi:tetratricopeptide (TPR) repeat protein